MSTYDSSVSTTAVEPSDLDDYLSYLSSPVADWLGGIYKYLTGETYANTYFGTSLSDEMTLIRECLLSIYNVLSPSVLYLTSSGNVSNVYSSSIGSVVASGFLGLSTNIKAVTSAIQSLNFNDYSTILSNIYSSVDGLESGLTSANTAIGGVTTAVNNVRTAVNNVVSGLSTVNTSVGTVNSSVNNVNTSVGTVNTNILSISDWLSRNFTIPSGASILGSDGSVVSISSMWSYHSMIRESFIGLRNFLYSQINLLPGSSVLYLDGTSRVQNINFPLKAILQHGFLGLSSNIKGSETDNIYTSTLYDNNNTTSSVNSTGLGPLLNTQLSNIGENLGHLAYIFASDEDIKLREDSQPLLDTTDSFYDDSDSNVKISTNNVGSLKDIAGNFTSIIDADADIGDTFAVVSNSNTYRWFSVDTAMNLDSLGVATVDFGESTYDRLHREFNEIYFPYRVGGGN